MWHFEEAIIHLYLERKLEIVKHAHERCTMLLKILLGNSHLVNAKTYNLNLKLMWNPAAHIIHQGWHTAGQCHRRGLMEQNCITKSTTAMKSNCIYLVQFELLHLRDRRSAAGLVAKKVYFTYKHWKSRLCCYFLTPKRILATLSGLFQQKS